MSSRGIEMETTTILEKGIRETKRETIDIPTTEEITIRRRMQRGD